MAELPNDVHELEDLLRATEGLLSEWRKARRTLEDEVRELVVWLFEPERFEKRKRRIGTFAGDDSYNLEDFERARQLPHPTILYRVRDIDERLRPLLDLHAMEKIGHQLESYWQSAVETCLSRSGCAEDDLRSIAEQRENVVKQLRDSIVAKRAVLNEQLKVAPIAPASPSLVAPSSGAKPVDAAKASKTEGAVSQGVFVYNGKRAENIQPAPWRLLEFMEDKSEAGSEEAYQHAIDEHDKDSTPGAIKGMIFKANQALLEVTHPKQLSKAKGVNKIVWV